MWLFIIKFITSNSRLLLPLVIGVGIVLYHFTAVMSYKSKINNLEGEMITYIKDAEAYKTQAAIDHAEIFTLKGTIKQLEDVVTENNTYISKLEVQEQDLKKEIKKWKSKLPKKIESNINKVLQVKDKKNVTCEELKEIHKKLSELKYSDL